jgi:hypothetical protein
MDGALLPNEHEYFRLYGLTDERLENAKPDAIVMHPGPINRGIELDSEVADGPALGDPAAGQLRHRGAHGGDVDGAAVAGRTTGRDMSLSIVNGRLIDPAHGIDDQLDLHVDGERTRGRDRRRPSRVHRR